MTTEQAPGIPPRERIFRVLTGPELALDGDRVSDWLDDLTEGVRASERESMGSLLVAIQDDLRKALNYASSPTAGDSIRAIINRIEAVRRR